MYTPTCIVDGRVSLPVSCAEVGAEAEKLDGCSGSP